MAEISEGSPAPLGPTWTEGLLHQLGRWRWRIDAAIERLGKAAETRVDSPKDYDDSEERSQEVMRILLQLIKRPPGNNYYEGGSGNGEKKTLNWILGVLAALLVGAVGGGVSVYGKVSSLETRVTEWQRASDRRMDATDQRLDRLENR
jgi:hypothetical protein